MSILQKGVHFNTIQNQVECNMDFSSIQPKSWTAEKSNFRITKFPASSRNWWSSTTWRRLLVAKLPRRDACWLSKRYVFQDTPGSSCFVIRTNSDAKRPRPESNCSCVETSSSDNSLQDVCTSFSSLLSNRGVSFFLYEACYKALCSLRQNTICLSSLVRM